MATKQAKHTESDSGEKEVAGNRSSAKGASKDASKPAKIKEGVSGGAGKKAAPTKKPAAKGGAKTGALDKSAGTHGKVGSGKKTEPDGPKISPFNVPVAPPATAPVVVVEERSRENAPPLPIPLATFKL